MFNDELSMVQCQRLLQRLRSCSQPFICAHGRPSVMPLTTLQHEGVTGGSIRWSDVNL